MYERDHLVLPQGNIPLLNRGHLRPANARPLTTADLEAGFEPSASPDDSDWFILDGQGRRVMKNRQQQVVEEKEVVTEAAEAEEEEVTEAAAAEVKEEVKETTEVPPSRLIDGTGFVPIKAPRREE